MQEEKRIYDSSSEHHFIFKNLSHQFDAALHIKRYIERDDVHDSCMVKAIFTNKQSGTVMDSIAIASLMFYTNYFTDPKNCVSYSCFDVGFNVKTKEDDVSTCNSIDGDAVFFVRVCA